MDVESPRASRLHDAIIASNTGQVLGFWIGTEEKGGDVAKMYINERMGLQIIRKCRCFEKCKSI